MEWYIIHSYISIKEIKINKEEESKYARFHENV